MPGRQYTLYLVIICVALSSSIGCGRSPGAAAQERLKTPRILRLVSGEAKPDVVTSLPMGVALVEAPPQNPDGLAASYAAGLRADSTHRSSSQLHIVSAGPLLDQPDEVFAHPMEQRNGVFILSIDYTNVRQTGAEIRKNVVWRPLADIELPAMPAPGDYRVEVTWQAVDSAIGRKPLAVPPAALSMNFRIEK